MKIRAIAAAVFICAASWASAQEQAPQQLPPGQVKLTVYGAGTSSCGMWLADRATPMHNFELSWVLGYLTASENYSASLQIPLRHTDANAAAGWVDKFCRENPLKDIADASFSLVVELSKPN
jgi:hypothetical protein